MELMLFTCARSIHINTDRKELKQVLHFRFSFEPRFSEDDKSIVDLSWTLDWRRTGGIVLLHESNGERRCYLTTHRLLVREGFGARFGHSSLDWSPCAQISTPDGELSILLWPI